MHLPVDMQWQLQTLDTLVCFTIETGHPIISTLSTSGNGRNWATKSPETELPARIELAGHIHRVEWTFSNAEASEHELEFVYTAEAFGLRLLSTWKSTDLPGPVEHEVRLINDSDKSIFVNPWPTICVNISPPQDHLLENWWVEKGAGYMSDEGVHIEPVISDYNRSLLSGTYSLEGLRREAIPWFSVQDVTSEHGVYGGIEFSGWTQVLIRKLTGGSISASLGLYSRDGLSTTKVRSGQTLTLPVCFIGAYQGGVEDGCNRLHRWVEKHLMPPIPDGATPILVNNSWGSGMAVTEELARNMIDDCARLGIELYHVDAGWYKNVGNWHTQPDKLPNGLEAIADYTHEKGLRFGLWVGWTQGGSGRDEGDGVLSVFNPGMKNWFGRDYPEDWVNWDFTGQTVCLGSPQAREWCLNELRRIVKQYKLDLLEHDQAMMIDQCTRRGHDHVADDMVDVSRSTAEGYYWVYDQLRAENPNLLFENCVNGGRIVDFGIMQRNHYVCSTDLYDPLSLRRTFYDTSYPLPPRMIELYIEQTPYDRLEGFKYMLRSSMLGWCTIMIDTTKWNEEEHEVAKREFELYKTELRPLIADGNVHHVLPRPDGKVWDGIQYYNPDTGKGTLLVFRPDSEQQSQTVVLRGLDPDKRYSIVSEDGSVTGISATGSGLMTSGMHISLPDRMSSDLIFFSVV